MIDITLTPKQVAKLARGDTLTFEHPDAGLPGRNGRITIRREPYPSDPTEEMDGTLRLVHRTDDGEVVETLRTLREDADG